MQLAADYKEDAVGHIAVRQHLAQVAQRDIVQMRCTARDALALRIADMAQPRLALSTPLGGQPPALQSI
jgi:hypothetical protein